MRFNTIFNLLFVDKVLPFSFMKRGKIDKKLREQVSICAFYAIILIGVCYCYAHWLTKESSLKKFC